MSTRIDVRELPDRLAEVLSQASAGGEVIAMVGNVPRARLVPLDQPPSRVAGLHAGAFRTAPDFDAPLPDDFWAGQT